MCLAIKKWDYYLIQGLNSQIFFTSGTNHHHHKRNKLNDVSNLLTVKYPLLNYNLRVIISTSCCVCQQHKTQNNVCWLIIMVIEAPDNFYY